MIQAYPLLSVHYSPGILTVLQRKPCPNHKKEHHTCTNAQIDTVQGVHLLQGEEPDWVLERSWIPR